MSKNANIIINVDDDKAIGSVNKLAQSFSKVEKSIDKANEASQELEDQAKQLAKAYFGLEAVKVVGELADAALTAAAANENLTGKTKETAEAYVKLKQNVADVAEGMVLAAANIAMSMSSVLGINDLLEDTASAWREIAGLQQRSTEDMLTANAYNTQLATISAIVSGYRTSAAEFEKYKDSNIEFANIAKKSMADYNQELLDANETLGKYGDKLNELQIQDLLLGKTTTTAIRTGEWDKQKKKMDELAAAAKAAANAESNRLQNISNLIKNSFGTDLDVTDRQYDKEVKNAEDALKAKLITQIEYTDALEKALQKRNKLHRQYEMANDNEASQRDVDRAAEAANRASKLAYADAVLKESKKEEDIKRDKELQEDLRDLHRSTAVSDKELLALDIADREEYYADLMEKYKDNADMQVEITRAKEADIQKLEEQTRAIRNANINEAVNGVLSLFSVMAKQDKKYATAFKALAIAQAITNTSIGITKAYAQGGVMGFVTGAGIAAAGAAQVATIKEQKFATGGIVDGTSYTGDKIPVSVNSGEMILTKTQQVDLFNKLNGGSNTQPITIQMNVGSGADSVNLRKILSENSSEFAAQVAKVLRNNKFNTTQAAI